MQNYKQLYAKKKVALARIKSVCHNIPHKSGIYVFTREEHGIHYGYVGQSLDIWNRCADHLLGYQHIDNSIKKHGLYDEYKNPNGYKVLFTEYKPNELDQAEQETIRYFANLGYQLRNKTIGGQGEGKLGLDDNRPAKGYHDGLKQGYLNAKKEIKVLFEKYLDFVIKEKPNKVKERKFAQFQEWLNDQEKGDLEDGK